MRLNRTVVSLALVLALVLAAGTMYALAACGQCAGATAAPAKMGCVAKAGGGCGMKMSGCCGAKAMGSCPRGLVRSKTRALSSGQVTLVARPRGLLLVVTNLSHQGDPNASVSVHGMGAERNAGLEARRVGPGRFALLGDLSGLDELAVRVNRAAASEVVYFGLAALHAPTSACKCGAVCKCGQAAQCKCGAACKATTAGRCSMMDSGRCKQMGTCKTPGATCPGKGSCCKGAPAGGGAN